MLILCQGISITVMIIIMVAIEEETVVALAVAVMIAAAIFDISCCDLICLDQCCECMGGDLIECI